MRLKNFVGPSVDHGRHAGRGGSQALLRKRGAQRGVRSKRGPWRGGPSRGRPRSRRPWPRVQSTAPDPLRQAENPRSGLASSQGPPAWPPRTRPPVPDPSPPSLPFQTPHPPCVGRGGGAQAQGPPSVARPGRGHCGPSGTAQGGRHAGRIPWLERTHAARGPPEPSKQEPSPRAPRPDAGAAPTLSHKTNGGGPRPSRHPPFPHVLFPWGCELRPQAAPSLPLGGV